MLGLANACSSSSYIPFSSTKSLSLDGGNDYLDVGTGIDLGTDDFSISLWVKTDDFHNKFFLSEYGDVNNRWYLRSTDSDPPRLQFQQVIGGVATSLYLGSSISLDDHQNAWTHILLTSDRDGKVIGYINGVADSADKNGDATNLTTTANTVIGKYAASTYSDYQIDEVAIWNSVLPAAAVIALYDNGNPTELTSAKGDYTAQANLTAWWRMGDGAFDNISVVHDQVNPGFEDEFIEGDDADFDTVGNWTGAGATVTGGYDSSDDGHATTLRIQADGTTNSRAELPQSAFRGSEATVVGKVYLVSFDFKWINTTSISHDSYVAIGGVAVANIDRTASGWTRYESYITANHTTASTKVYVNGDSGHADNEILIDNFSIKELKGNPGLVVGGVSSFSDSFSNSFN